MFNLVAVNLIMKHQIDIEGLREWQQEWKVLYASSSKDQKRFYCTLRGSYEVYHKGEKVLETMQLFTAIEKYNEL